MNALRKILLSLLVVLLLALLLSNAAFGDDWGGVDDDSDDDSDDGPGGGVDDDDDDDAPPTPEPTDSPEPTDTPSPEPTDTPVDECTPGWVCVAGTDFKAYQNADCTLDYDPGSDYCGHGCLNGECNDAPCVERSCSYYYTRRECGLGLSDGCENSLNCTACGGGLDCVNRQCVCVPQSCNSLGLQCGSASDNCGGSLDCGSCERFGAGYECEGNICELEPEEKELELRGVQAFPSAGYAVVFWLAAG